MFENPPVERFHKIAVEAVGASQFSNTREQLALALDILQWQRRICFQRRDLGHEPLTFSQRLDQATINIIETVAN
jgi:hypothetical protein